KSHEANQDQSVGNRLVAVTNLLTFEEQAGKLTLENRIDQGDKASPRHRAQAQLHEEQHGFHGNFARHINASSWRWLGRRRVSSGERDTLYLFWFMSVNVLLSERGT